MQTRIIALAALLALAAPSVAAFANEGPRHGNTGKSAGAKSLEPEKKQTRTPGAPGSPGRGKEQDKVIFF